MVGKRLPRQWTLDSPKESFGEDDMAVETWGKLLFFVMCCPFVHAGIALGRSFLCMPEFRT